MPSQLTFADDSLKFFNDPAKTEFVRLVEQYGIDLISEAGRLESAGKSTQGNPEITSSMVKDADLLIRRGYSRRPKKPVLMFVQVVAAVGGFLTGILADAEKLKNTGLLIIFILFLAATITATVFAVIKD